MGSEKCESGGEGKMMAGEVRGPGWSKRGGPENARVTGAMAFFAEYMDGGAALAAAL